MIYYFVRIAHDAIYLESCETVEGIAQIAARGFRQVGRDEWLWWWKIKDRERVVERTVGKGYEG